MRMPSHARGMRIGLLGGSFNPAHAAHRQISLFALKRLGLDRIWWLVTPGNPLKTTSVLPPVAQRVAAAQALARHPRIVVTGIESALGTHYTHDTLTELLKRAPEVRFVWLMGADNLAGFHRWEKWADIARLVPIAVIDRGRSTLRAIASPAGQALAPYREPEQAALRMSYKHPPSWVYLFGLKSPLSSSALRGKKEQRHG